MVELMHYCKPGELDTEKLRTACDCSVRTLFYTRELDHVTCPACLASDVGKEAMKSSLPLFTKRDDEEDVDSDEAILCNPLVHAGRPCVGRSGVTINQLICEIIEFADFDDIMEKNGLTEPEICAALTRVAQLFDCDWSKLRKEQSG